MKNIKSHIALWIALICFNTQGIAQAVDSSLCNGDDFLKSANPDSIAYDNIVSNFHATFVRQKDGTVIGWGENMGPQKAKDILIPTIISPENGYHYKGQPLKFTAGSIGIHTGQYALLTTTGLYVWGKAGFLISDDIKKGTDFGAVEVDGEKNGLPPDVQPENVKMLFGSYKTLALVTKNGQTWVLSGVGSKGGNGKNENQPNQWIHVHINAKKTLDEVIAVRGTAYALMALTAKGEIYTWGRNTYLGDGQPAKDRFYATQMRLPNDIRPKMIGMTVGFMRETYYVLATNGNLYSLGYNVKRQLGIWGTFQKRYWVSPRKPNEEGEDSGVPFTNVAWISPNEHDGSGIPAINILTKKGKLYAWGLNHRGMIGGQEINTPYDPMFMPGKLDTAAVILAVETGGHTTFVIQKGRKGYGFVGHKIYGSMGDGTSSEVTGKTYHFIDKKEIYPCGVPQIIKKHRKRKIIFKDSSVKTLSRSYASKP